MRGVLNHETATKKHLPESYILGELTGRKKTTFENHYFGCTQCAEDVKLVAVFAANAQAIFRAEAKAKKHVSAPVQGNGPARGAGRQLKPARRHPRQT